MDPLAQLKDIHLPEQIHNYPIAPGWWILLFIITTTIIYFFVKWLKAYRFAKAKRQAIKLLAEIDDAEENQNNDIMNLLKWAALQYFPRVQVAPLFGQQLQHFLTESLPEKFQTNFAELSQSAFEHRYQIDELTIEDQSFKKAALLWLNHALPPIDKKPEQRVSSEVNDTKNTAETSTKPVEDNTRNTANLISEATK